MELAAYRTAQGLTQGQVARKLGRVSKGHISALETGARRAPMALALQIEALTNGEVAAESLLENEDAALLAGHCRFAAARAAGAAACS